MIVRLTGYSCRLDVSPTGSSQRENNRQMVEKATNDYGGNKI